jgi:hypothetical protein
MPDVNNFEVVENARIAMNYILTETGTKVRIVVNEKYEHTFSQKSKVSHLVMEMEKEVLFNKLNGGTYVFSNSKLIDFRFSDYKGFIRKQGDIETLANKIGFADSRKEDKSRRSVGEVFEQFRHSSQGIFLGGASEAFYLDVNGLGKGGSFKNRIIYKWSPFDQNIQTTIEVERLVCANGMVGIAPLVTRGVPLLSDIERNLEIIELNLQPSINNLLQTRFVDMADKRASVADVTEAHRMLAERAANNNLTVTDRSILEKLAESTSLTHLRGVYAPDLFTSKAARTAPSDITQFDLFNVLTEATSHTSGDKEENFKIQRMVNKLVFDTTKTEVAGSVKISAESDHSRVFFGK